MGPFSRHEAAERAVPYAAFVLALLLGRAAAAGFVTFPLDDAWIHLSYAKSLRLGEGLSYNPQDYETGFSSPLWVLVLALVPWGPAPAPAVAWLAAFFYGLGAYGVTSFARRVARARATASRPVPVLSIAAAVAVCTAVSPLGLLSVASGMEVALAFALAALFLDALWFRTAPAAATMAALAVLARPESLVFVGTAAAFAAYAPGRRRAAAAAAAAAGAMAAWSGYCMAVSGHPLPNTYYVKAGRGGLDGLSYLLGEVLSWQPEVVSLLGVVLWARALRSEGGERARPLASVLAAVAVTFAAIVLGRPLHPGVLFYEARYFAPFAIFTTALVPLGLGTGRRPWLWAGAVVVVVAVATMQARDLLRLGRAMAEDVAAVHEAPARWVARHLPSGAIVAVEGAGAMRFFTPRTMRIVDLVGLNDRVLAHLHFDRRAKLCAIAAKRPGYFVVPSDWRPLFDPPFALAAVTAFFDPAYHQVDPPRPHRVTVFEVRGTVTGALGCPTPSGRDEGR